MLWDLVNCSHLEGYSFSSRFRGFLSSGRAVHQVATYILSSSASFSRELEVFVWSYFDAYHDCDLSVISEFPFPGPRLFLSCPIDVDGSRVWFTDLWNYSIIPYLLEAVREGLQVSRQKWRTIGLEWYLFKRQPSTGQTWITATFSVDRTLHAEYLHVCENVA